MTEQRTVQNVEKREQTTSLREKLMQVLPEGGLRENESMGRHTTFRAGGPADYFAEPQSADQLAGVIRVCREAGEPYAIVGNGSNLLVGDLGYHGAVISIGKAFGEIRVEDNRIFAGAGALLASVARNALTAELTGFEFAAGIPGSVGGAVVMNAGAYGSEMKDVMASATVLTPEGEVVTIASEDLELGYRASCVLKKGYVVLGAEFMLEHGDPEKIREQMDELAGKRREKQPLEYPSAGSTFKRPQGDFAGRLIEVAGLRGFRVGDAQVSEKHCGFVINRGEASSADILSLCRQVQERVKENSGVELELEVKLLGEFSVK